MKLRSVMSSIKVRFDLTLRSLFKYLRKSYPHLEDLGPEHPVSVGQKVKYLMGVINYNHEIMHISNMMLEKRNTGHDRVI